MSVAMMNAVRTAADRDVLLVDYSLKTTWLNRRSYCSFLGSILERKLSHVALL